MAKKPKTINSLQLPSKYISLTIGRDGRLNVRLFQSHLQAMGFKLPADKRLLIHYDEQESVLQLYAPTRTERGYKPQGPDGKAYKGTDELSFYVSSNLAPDNGNNLLYFGARPKYNPTWTIVEMDGCQTLCLNLERWVKGQPWSDNTQLELEGKAETGLDLKAVPGVWLDDATLEQCFDRIRAIQAAR